MYTSQGFGPQSRIAAWMRSTMEAPAKSVASLTPFVATLPPLTCAGAAIHPPKASSKQRVRKMRREVPGLDRVSPKVDIPILTR
jgi:hypothetical protein